jgi:hypothetical protein
VLGNTPLGQSSQSQSSVGQAMQRKPPSHRLREHESRRRNLTGLSDECDRKLQVNFFVAFSF